jgi:hypothetical protein
MATATTISTDSADRNDVGTQDTNMGAGVVLEKGPVVPDPGDDSVQQFPEGGVRAWMVATGTALIMFSTLGYVNSWG